MQGNKLENTTSRIKLIKKKIFLKNDMYIYLVKSKESIYKLLELIHECIQKCSIKYHCKKILI